MILSSNYLISYLWNRIVSVSPKQPLEAVAYKRRSSLHMEHTWLGAFWREMKKARAAASAQCTNCEKQPLLISLKMHTIIPSWTGANRSILFLLQAYNDVYESDSNLGNFSLLNSTCNRALHLCPAYWYHCGTCIKFKEVSLRFAKLSIYRYVEDVS